MTVTRVVEGSRPMGYAVEVDTERVATVGAELGRAVGELADAGSAAVQALRPVPGCLGPGALSTAVESATEGWDRLLRDLVEAGESLAVQVRTAAEGYAAVEARAAGAWGGREAR